MTTKAPPRKMGLQHRFVDVQREAINEDARTIEVAFSSEYPVPRDYGNEILDHSPSAVRLGRMKDGGAVLVDHDPSDHIGVVEDVQITNDRKGRAVLRFGKSQRASEIWQDVVDGIRRFVSVGYAVHRMVLDAKGKDSPDSYRVTDWEPYEISLVAIPADPSAGVGRADSREFDVELIAIQEEPNMTTENQSPAVDVRAVENEAREAERTRVREILAVGALHNRSELAQKAVAEGTSLTDFRGAVLAEIAKAQPKVDASVGLTDKEVKRFSFVRLIEGIAREKTGQQGASNVAGFEFEVVRAAAQKRGGVSRGVIIPPDVLLEKRDLTVGTNSAGGYTVATDLEAGSFIDVLRNRMAMQALGATFLTGLVGNIAIPRKTAGSTVYWVAENSAPTEGALTFDQVTMGPKTVAAYVDYSRKLTLQSSLNVESLVRNDLAAGIATELDRVGVNGSGSSNQPTGVLNTSGIGDVAGGTNGLAPTWAHIIELETDVAVANADIGGLAYYTNAKVRGKLKGTEKASSTAQYIWSDGSTPLNGYRAVVSNQVPSTLTKGTSSGVCSAILFGNWADVLIGLWSGIDLLVDPYTGSSAGTVRVTAFQDCDVAVRHAESFSAMKDALTA